MFDISYIYTSKNTEVTIINGQATNFEKIPFSTEIITTINCLECI